MTKTLEVGELLIVLMLVIACHATKKTNPAALPSFDKEAARHSRARVPAHTIPLAHKIPYPEARAEDHGR